MISEKEQAILKEFFGPIAGACSRDIAARLTAKGVLSRYGKPYTKNSLLPILRGEKHHPPTELAILQIIQSEISRLQTLKALEIEVIEPIQVTRPMKRRRKIKPQPAQTHLF